MQKPSAAKQRILDMAKMICLIFFCMASSGCRDLAETGMIRVEINAPKNGTCLERFDSMWVPSLRDQST